MKYLILGNGPAGVIAAETLRKADPNSTIKMIGSEVEPPYSRMAIPYFLEGNIDEAGTYLRKSSNHFDRLSIINEVGKAVAVNSSEKQVHLADGSTESYDKLLIATGSYPIRPPIPGIDLPNVHTCWTLEDARAISRLATQGKKVVQVGAGFIGCIILEALAKNGVDLTVVELGDRMVPRMMTPKAGSMIKDWVQSKGVRVVTSARVERIDSVDSADTSGQRMTVAVSNGEAIECDLVIMSAGVKPNIDFLSGSGVEIANGVLVDRNMRSSIPDIYAAGDVAEAPDLFSQTPMVSAIQPNAADQARIAAMNMASRSVPHAGVLAINVLDTLGLISSSFGEWEGVEGGDGVELAEAKYHRYISLQFKNDVLVGATSVGLTQHVGVLRGLIQSQTRLGDWKEILLNDPLRVMDAYLACAQKPMALNG